MLTTDNPVADYLAANPEKRLGKLLSEMREWATLEQGEAEVTVELKPLASLLGKLVFASQVVEGGRTYMQGMLASFKGLVVDWHRGATARTSSLRWRSWRGGATR